MEVLHEPLTRGFDVSDDRYLRGERTADEQVWSAGDRLTSRQVAEAFGLGADVARRDGPAATPRMTFWIIALVVFILLVMMLSQCQSNRSRCDNLAQEFGQDSAQYRSCLSSRSSGGHGYGGSWGGSGSGGGGHK